VRLHIKNASKFLFYRHKIEIYSHFHTFKLSTTAIFTIIDQTQCRRNHSNLYEYLNQRRLLQMLSIGIDDGGIVVIGGTGIFGKTSVFVNGLYSDDVVEELGEQQNHSDDDQDERYVVQRLVAQSVIGCYEVTTGIGEGDGVAGCVVNITELVNGSGDTQTDDEDEDDVEDEGVLSLVGQQKLQEGPNDHQTSAGQEKTSGGAAPAASDNSLQAGGTGDCVKDFSGNSAFLLTVDEGDLLAGNVVGALVCTVIGLLVVDFTVLGTELVVAGVLGCGIGKKDQDDRDSEEEESERFSTDETHEI